MNKRPTALTELQIEKFYKKLANELIVNKWTNTDVERVMFDLQRLTICQSGYEIAKELEKHNGCCYHFTIDFLEWLDKMDDRFESEIKNKVKKWVQSNNIKPKFINGDLLVVNKTFYHGFVKFPHDTHIYIHLYDAYEAKYYIKTYENTDILYSIAIEIIEAHCSLVNN